MFTNIDASLSKLRRLMFGAIAVPCQSRDQYIIKEALTGFGRAIMVIFPL
jgi:hypothetical protein